MYKRRLYKQEHADKDELSDSSSSSSSDSESEAEPQQEEREEEENAQEEVDIDSEAPEINGYEKKISCPSSGSGYESEDSSEKEVKYDSSDDDEEIGNDITNFFDGSLTGKGNAEAEVAQINTRTKKDSIETDYSDRILKCKSVYKCRLCPRLVCLTEESLRAHLNSKRHARSEKLLKEGRLKFMLNSDGEIEEDPETHAERHARTLALAQQDSSNKKKKNRGRQRQRLRLKRKKNGDAPEKAKEKEPTKNRTNKKRRKVGD
ncbi:hypothetical protein FRX31_022113 [Thalictrum thalictroides]|uniref:Uncharacterized protein n=1 Tax=Thalictrum thalictroides TaxID=46969 RepID=A0A7J6VT89_THATH|nr:hypothetical protein FRX31_022113 [Thalictrum thalictroides]